MSEDQRTDTANEPVDSDDSEFMDTGVFHECKNPNCKLPHPHPEENQ